MVATQQDRAALQRKLNERLFEQNMTLPFIDLLVQEITKGKECGNLDPVCLDNQKGAIKMVSNTIAFYIAVFSELMKNAFVFIALGLMFPQKTTPVTLVARITGVIYAVIGTPKALLKWWASLKETETKTKAEAQGQRSAELEFEKNLLREKQEKKILILEAVPWMKSIVMEQLSMLVDIDKAMEGKRVPKHEVSLLFILVCREYAPNKQIPNHATLAEIRRKAKEDKEYIRALMGEFNIPHEDILETIKKVCKLHRFRGIVLPGLVAAGLVSIRFDSNGDQVYYWQSIESVETGFKFAIKREQGKDNG